ncbi:hypothetical protein HDU96_010048 [Phlyctochytrium bullatum]|nr:hypothetical protein HDU96_010048 [Phlyctochytrium bullatum]
MPSSIPTLHTSTSRTTLLRDQQQQAGTDALEPSNASLYSPTSTTISNLDAKTTDDAVVFAIKSSATTLHTAQDSAVITETTPSTSLYYPKPSALSPRRQVQFAMMYIAVNALVAGLVSGASGYGISYALYAPGNPPPSLRSFAGTFPGDIVVTMLIQNILVWITTSISVFLDLRCSRALPLPAPKLLITPTSTSDDDMTRVQRLFHWFSGPRRQADVFAPGLQGTHRAHRVRNLLARAAASSAICSPLYAAFMIACVYAAYAPIGVTELPLNEALWIKAIGGAVFGAMQTVLVALIGLWSVDTVFLYVEKDEFDQPFVFKSAV